MGSPDRVIRILIALVIIFLFINHTITGTWSFVLLAIAGIFLLTSFVGICPLYSIFGFSSGKVKKD